MSSPRDEVKARLAALIASGFHSAESALDELSDEIDELDAPPIWRRALSKQARQLEDQQREREADWDDFTVNDRIDSAFLELDARRVVARQNVGYTLSEGWADLRPMANRGGRAQLGGLFYHGQDLERALVGEGLMLAFGSFEPDDPEGDIAVAREVIEVFARNGIELEWNGSPDTRLSIAPFEWRRRHFTDAPGYVVIVKSCEMDKRMAVLKTCKKVLGMSLKDARAGLNTLEPGSWRFDRSTPWIVMRGLSFEQARRYVAALKEAGAECSFR